MSLINDCWSVTRDLLCDFHGAANEFRTAADTRGLVIRTRPGREAVPTSHTSVSCIKKDFTVRSVVVVSIDFHGYLQYAVASRDEPTPVQDSIHFHTVYTVQHAVNMLPTKNGRLRVKKLSSLLTEFINDLLLFFKWLLTWRVLIISFGYL